MRFYAHTTAMLHDILEHHATELPFLWTQRDDAARAPQVDLRALAEHDERIEAHVDGLRIAGDEGAKVAIGALDEGDPASPFAAALLAIERRDAHGLEGALAIAKDAAIARAVISAFGWAPAAAATAALEPMLAADAPPHHRAIGLAAWATHREDPGGALVNALLDGHALVRARALRVAGEVGRRDLLPELARALDDADEACRFWAARSIALLGDPSPPSLWDFVESDVYGMRAVELAARRTDPGEARGRLEALSARPERARVAIAGAGALGDPGAISWLLALMEDEALARIVGEAITMITGVAIEGDLASKAAAKKHKGPSDDPRDADVTMDPDLDRPWPDKGALMLALRSRAADLRRGQRYLLGQPITEGLTTRVLREGKQPERAAAAIERCLLAPGRPLFEVRARVIRQKVG